MNTPTITIGEVERLHHLLGGDPILEGHILDFILDKYGARNLLHLPPAVAQEIARRPADFIRAVKQHIAPLLPF